MLNIESSPTKMAVMTRSGGARKSRPDDQTYSKYDAYAPLPQGEKRYGHHRDISLAKHAKRRAPEDKGRGRQKKTAEGPTVAPSATAKLDPRNG
jgi:hypothetical protein